MPEIKDLTNASLEDILNEKNKLIVGDKEFVIDPSKLYFNDATIGKFMEEAGSWYGFFGALFAEAESISAFREAEYEAEYCKKFAEYKDSGISDKLAEAKAKSDVSVVEKKNLCVLMKRKVKLLQQHLRAWDKAHENAQNRNYTLRKEMDKLTGKFSSDDNTEEKLEDILKH